MVKIKFWKFWRSGAPQSGRAIVRCHTLKTVLPQLTEFQVRTRFKVQSWIIEATFFNLYRRLKLFFEIFGKPRCVNWARIRQVHYQKLIMKHIKYVLKSLFYKLEKNFKCIWISVLFEDTLAPQKGEAKKFRISIWTAIRPSSKIWKFVFHCDKAKLKN